MKLSWLSRRPICHSDSSTSKCALISDCRSTQRQRTTPCTATSGPASTSRSNSWLGVVQPRRPPRAWPVDQTFHSCLIVADHPVPEYLAIHAAGHAASVRDAHSSTKAKPGDGEFGRHLAIDAPPTATRTLTRSSHLISEPCPPPRAITSKRITTPDLRESPQESKLQTVGIIHLAGLRHDGCRSISRKRFPLSQKNILASPLGSPNGFRIARRLTEKNEYNHRYSYLICH